MKKRKRVNKNKIIEKDGVRLNQKIINCIKKNSSKILQGLYILNKTGFMIDLMLTIPRNLLEIDSPLLAEALEDEKCKKEFMNIIDEYKQCNKDVLSPLIYDIVTNLKCDKNCLLTCISIVQQEREELKKAISENNIFKIAKSIWALRAFTTSIAYYVLSCESFFEKTGLNDMYNLLLVASEIYVNQVVKMEKLMYAV